MNPICPNCGSIIYSRRNKLCGVCETLLPEELLFSPEEKKQWDKVIEVEKRSQANNGSADSGSGGSTFISSTDFSGGDSF